MTITLRHLSGTREPLDVTICAHLRSNWNSGNITGAVTPIIEPITYIPAMNVDEDNQGGPNIIKLSVIKRYRDPEEPNGDDSHYWISDVEIDIWAESFILMQQFEDEVNRILWTIAPNESVRLKKSNAANPPVVGSDNSEVESFKYTEIDFDFLGSTGDGSSQTVSSQGILMCRWFKLKT